MSFVLLLLTSAPQLKAGSLRIDIIDTTGNTSSFYLSQFAEIKFNDAEMRLTDGNLSYSLPLERLAKWVYGIDTGLETVNAPDCILTQVGNTLVIKSNRVLDNIDVYAINGSLLSTYNADNNEFTISTDKWLPGVYLIKIGVSIYKIEKI